MKKQLLSLALVGALTLSMGLLSGCNKSNNNSDGSNSQGTTSWPQKDVTVYVPAAAGGGTDIFARAVADYLQRSTGKNFTVVNMDSGSGMVAFEQVRNAEPDGSSIMFWHAGMYVSYYSGQYDHNPNTDFSPLVMFEAQGDDGKQAFVVKGDSEWNTLSDLLDDAKANPDTITYGCTVGGSAQMVAEMLMQASGAQLHLVDAASQTDKITGVAGGNIDVSAITYSAAQQYVESGDLKIIGIVDKEGTEEYQSAYEQGYEECYWTQNLGVWGPAGMDESLCKAINEAFLGMSEDEEVMGVLEQSKMINLPTDYETSMAMFQDFDALVKEASDNITWG